VRIANRASLNRVQFALIKVDQGIKTQRSARLYWVLGTLARLGYSGFTGPAGALADTIGRLTGSSPSRSTLFRALKDLEIAGLISRSPCRFGESWGGLILHFSKEMCDKNAQVSRRNALEHTKIPASLPVVSTLNNIARPVDRQKRVHRIDPVIYTIRLVTKGRANRAELCAAAVRDQTAKDSKIFKWGRLRERWRNMTILEREHVAKTEIVPGLEKWLQPLCAHVGANVSEVADLLKTGEFADVLLNTVETSETQTARDLIEAQLEGWAARSGEILPAAEVAGVFNQVDQVDQVDQLGQVDQVDQVDDLGVEQSLTPDELDILKRARSAATERYRQTG